jgi:hypothetical protein
MVIRSAGCELVGLECRFGGQMHAHAVFCNRAFHDIRRRWISRQLEENF